MFIAGFGTLKKPKQTKRYQLPEVFPNFMFIVGFTYKRNSVRPIDSSPPGSSIPGILQARTLEWVAISFSNAWKWKVKVKSLSRLVVSDS